MGRYWHADIDALKVGLKIKFLYFWAISSSYAKGQSLAFCHEYNLDQGNAQEH